MGDRSDFARQLCKSAFRDKTLRLSFRIDFIEETPKWHQDECFLLAKPYCRLLSKQNFSQDAIRDFEWSEILLSCKNVSKIKNYLETLIEVFKNKVSIFPNPVEFSVKNSFTQTLYKNS